MRSIDHTDMLPIYSDLTGDEADDVMFKQVHQKKPNCTIILHIFTFFFIYIKLVQIIFLPQPFPGNRRGLHISGKGPKCTM